MSQANADSTNQDVIKLLQEFIVDSINVGLVALPLYEYLITIDQEVELVWKQKTRFSLPSALLVSTRICMVITAILTVAGSTDTCTGYEAVSIVEQIMDLAGYIQVALFSALRVSALYDRNLALFVTVFVLGLVPMGPNIFGVTRTVYIQEPGTCLQDSSIPDALTQKLVLVSRIPVIVADFLVLTLTWAKTYKQILRSHGNGLSTTLSTCLARDGALYFLVLLTINILQIATYQTHLGAPVDVIVATLPSVLINRFMLNLRQAGYTPNASDPENPDHSAISTLRFQLSEQVVGSMGEPLDHGGSYVSDEVEGGVSREGIEVDGYSPECDERKGTQARPADVGKSSTA